MRRNSGTVVVVALVAVAFCATERLLAAPPTPLEQAAIDALNSIFGTTGSTPPPSTTPPNTSRPSANTGMLPNPVEQVPANRGSTSGTYPRGTRVNVGGPGTSGQQFTLPITITVNSNGSITRQNHVPTSNVINVDNQSPNNIILEFIKPGATSSTPVTPTPSGPAAAPNNRSSVGTGNVTVTNRSGGTVRVDYKLPRGKYYGPSGYSTLWISLGNRGTDDTSGIAENTRINFGGYVDEFFVARDQQLHLTIHPTYVSASAVPLTSPNPSPAPNPNPSPTPSPAPNPGPSSNPAPAPTPNSGSGGAGTFPLNPIPQPQTTPLTNAISQALAERVNKDVASILNDFDRASVARVEVLKRELIAAGFPANADAVTDIPNAAKNGDPTALTALIKQHGTSDIPRSLQAAFLATATFRKSYNDLLVKFEAGNPAAGMTPEFEAVKSLAATLAASGLAEAMTLVQQELLIRDKISRASVSSVLNVGQQSLPTGPVTIIRHPEVSGQATYLGDGGLILTRSNDQKIVVFVSTAGGALGLPTSSDTPVVEAKTTSPATGITISNPATNGKPVDYTLNGKRFTIQPNYSQQLTSGTTWEIEFSPNANAANTKYSLTADGTYVFVDRNGKTDLASKEFRIDLHNPTTSQLIYTFDNKQSVVLEAGAKTDHRSSLPMLVQFDRDGGSSSSSKLLQENGDYYFALNQDEVKWDLFSGNSLRPTTATSKQAVTIARPSLDSLKKNAGSMLFDFRAVAASPSGGCSLLDDLLKAGQ